MKLLDSEKSMLDQACRALDALLKAACEYEETDTPMLSAAINQAMHARDNLREWAKGNQ